MNTEMENGTQMTLEECVPMISQKQTVGASDSLAKISQLPESNLDFKGTVQACFSELCTLSDSSKKKINPLQPKIMFINSDTELMIMATTV